MSYPQPDEQLAGKIERIRQKWQEYRKARESLLQKHNQIKLFLHFLYTVEDYSTPRIASIFDVSAEYIHKVVNAVENNNQKGVISND